MTTGQQAQAPTSTLKRAYLEMERLHRRLAEYERTRTEPVAVVGLGLRLPGGAVDAESYWRILRDGVDAVDEIPADRWPVDEFYDTEPQQPGKMRTRWGGFLDRVDRFDYEFFGISRREALAMDPQQRLALEVSWEALENAGHAPTGLAGSRTGVFLGVCSNDFATENFPGLEDITAYASTGTAHSVVTGRISYVFDFRGPSVAVDTACSSSLVSVHMAVQSLRTGECDLALGGGVNVVLSPLPSVAFSQFPGMVAPDGRCKTFDVRANGYVRSEGCGIVVLKRLSDAVRDGDRVLAVIRGGAVNQDGRSSGVTAPNGVAQRDVLRRALEASEVAPEQVSYVEAHGTGTTLGDPIEVEALAEVYGREEGAPVYLGSSKTNIGHAEAASGIAGLIKVVLALHQGAIPPNVHFTGLNPHISFAGTTFVVPTALSEWPAVAERPIAGVSSFGFSGTNAHLILQAAPEPPAAPEGPAAERPRSVLPLSAKTPNGLLELAKRYQRRLAADPATPLADICYSAGIGRAHFTHRLAAVGSRQEVADQLADYVDGLPGDLPVVGTAGGNEVVFLFTGQGPQRVGMARTLYETQPTFRQVIDRCDEILRPLLEVPLLDVIYPADPESDLVYRTTYSQPALFAVQYAMAQLWRSWGVEPVAVLGHSFGEYVAACVAGMMSLEDGLRLVVDRGRLMWELAENGAMVAVFAAEAEVADVLAPYADRVSIAAVNGPGTTSISGEREALAEICAEFDRREVKTKQLHITTSSHSPLIEPILPGLRKAADSVSFTPPRVPLVANLTGELWPWDTAPDADYWCRHARQPVRFAASIDTLRELGYRTFIEMGPAPTLLGMISDNLPAGEEALLVPSLRPKHDDWAVLLNTVARLYAAGVDLDWSGFDRDYRRARVPLPTYPFEQTHCWQERRRTDRDRYAAPAGAAVGTDDPADEYADDDLLYRLDWQPAEAPASAGDAPPAPARTWLVLADAAGIGTGFADAVAARGERAVRVVPGAAYRFGGGAEAEVRIDGPADLGRLLDELRLDGADLQVLHLWSLDGVDAGTGAADAAALLRAHERGGLSAVYAAQALARAQGPESVRLWLVTRGAVQPTGAADTAGGPVSLEVAQSTLWGLGRSLQQEHSALWGGLIDLDPRATPAALADRLVGELTRRDAEDQIALRGDQRYVARLVRQAVPEVGVGEGPWRPDAGYLITGGLGGLGLEVARSMVRAGARRLVLLGRTTMPPRAEWADLPADGPIARRVAAVRELEALGASVHLESADVADEAAMRALLTRYDREGWPAIRGVIHAAGTGEVAPLLELTRADLERPLLPKAVGAWVLHRLFADRELDFFVLFSSTSSLLSSPFVAGYAAANAFLDALAARRRAAGLPGLSVNWGIWGGVGLANRGAEANPGLSKGMGTLRPGQALRVFHRLLHHDDAQIAVVPVDWAEWGRRYQEVSGSALLAPLLRGDGPARPARRRARASLLPSRAQLLALPADRRAETLIGQLVLSVAATLGSGPEAVGRDQPLFDLGLDSLMAVELKNEIERQLGVALSIAVFLEGATLRTLTDQIISGLPVGEDDGSADTAGIHRVERFEDVALELLAELEGLSDKQARAALEQEG